METTEDRVNDSAERFTHEKYEEAKELYAQGKYKEAADIFIQVYTIQRLPSVFGPEHTKTLTTQLNIADTLIELGKCDEARKILTELEELIESVRHRDTIEDQIKEDKPL